MYKTSYYNFLIPVPERSEYLLYNSFSGGLVVLNKQEGKLITEVSGQENIPRSQFEKHENFFKQLIEKGYLVDAATDDIEAYYDLYKETKKKRFYDKQSNLVLTIATTNQCNMACPYCYEFTKSRGVLSDQNMQALVNYLENIIHSSDIQEWSKLGVTWYGGEPLLAPRVIEKLTDSLLEFADKHNIEYAADIVTNGTQLSRENWELLQTNKVRWAQVTIDGPKETHEKNRPLKNKKGKNYERILENMAAMPEGMRATIRVNCDTKIASLFPKFLQDLQEYGIWPQRYKSINIATAWLRTYEEAGEKDTACRIPYDEFEACHEELRNVKLDFFNKWAQKNDIPLAKLAWDVPKPEFEECWSAVSPYCMVIDAAGYTHKCWENVHDKSTRIQHVSERFNIQKYKEWLDHDRFKLNQTCYECKYLPICGDLNCAQAVFDKRANCTTWKSIMNRKLKDQYLLWTECPDKIAFRADQRDNQTNGSE